jgi:tRNA(His) 5'-end guanylyltransferase
MKPGKDQLGDRIKKYENSWRIKLPERLPVILRLDGVSFHSYTKGCERPFDENLVSCMNDTALYLCNNIQNVVAAYIQSDEISILINNYKQLNTESWHGNNIQKMSSVAASMASAYFTSISDRIFGKLKVAHFDCRAFVVPKEEVNNAFLHRQQDATRNSIQMLTRSLYSHNQCNLKNTSQLQEMCYQKGFNWNDLPTSQKRGRCIIKEKTTISGINVKTNEPFSVERGKWKVDNEIPIFSKDPNYIMRLI